MNKKQWYVLGVGLILMSMILLLFGLNGEDCSEINVLNIKMKLSESITTDVDTQLLSCYIKVIINSNISFAFLGLGILFLICSFLEVKQKN